MPYLKYSTTYGNFFVIADDDIYNNTAQLVGGSKTLVTSNDVITADGLLVQSIIDTSLIIPELSHNTDSLNEAVLNAFRLIFPYVVLHKTNVNLGDSSSANYIINNDRGVTVDLNVPADATLNRLVLKNTLILNNDTNDSYPNFPYGHFTSSSQLGSNCNYVIYELLIANSDFTQFRIALFSAQPNWRVRISVRNLPTGETLNFYNNYFSGVTPVVEKADPYAPGGTSGSGGGTGDFDLSSDAVDFPSLPTLTAVSTGLVSIYTPSLTQLNALASYMWNANPTDIDWWKKLVANPLDLILGLSIVPVAVPAGATQNVKVGLIDTGVSMTKAATQFVEVDCGSLNVSEFWGSALDYSPFRKHSIYLPFIGTRTINTDDIMNKTVSVKYHVDLLSGALTALVKCGDAVLYQYSGACAVSLPLSGETFTNMITSTIQLAASVAGTIASGGAAAGITAAAAANSVMSMKPQIERAGGVSGAAGQLGIMTPYLIGEIPRQSVPENANTFYGYPSNIKATLGDLTGFTTVESIHLQGIPATAAEYAEIEQLLKEGVIL